MPAYFSDISLSCSWTSTLTRIKQSIKKNQTSHEFQLPLQNFLIHSTENILPLTNKKSKKKLVHNVSTWLVITSTCRRSTYAPDIQAPTRRAACSPSTAYIVTNNNQIKNPYWSSSFNAVPSHTHTFQAFHLFSKIKRSY